MNAHDEVVACKHDVFISYAHLDCEHDIANAQALGGWLESEGYDVWWDRSLLRGNVQKQLVQKASSAKSVIALWSANAEQSKYVFVECVLAAANETLIPLIIGDQALPSEWTHLLYIKLSDLEAQKAEILHMAGLFDRPAEREALEALLAPPAIAGLTEAFHALTPSQRKARWNVAAERLRKLKLIAGGDGGARQGQPGGQTPDQPGALDAHPIVRAHFGERLKRGLPEAWREAHGRLYDFYRYQGLPQAFCTPEAYGVLALVASFPNMTAYVKEHASEGRIPPGAENAVGPIWTTGSRERIAEAAKLTSTPAFEAALTAFLPGSVEAMRPCFAAIAHGCASGRHQEAYREVYFPRVQRGNEAFIQHKLGALNAGLAALAPFFEALWSTPAAGLRDNTKAMLLNFAAFALRALGRLREAAEPFEARYKGDVAARDWKDASLFGGQKSSVTLLSTVLLALK